ncbi:sesquiterpene synthase 14b isoform X1 [Capsicum annuum]|uniref:sesquiterpene synthase 14b isoform X1 n=1 Tax=Capsicum annuum TaxID=4072 RepID=UPI001FB0DD0A|nr:sesquiterpene synthase 14b isoform X1 [Capsicum annuum]
MSQLAMVNTTIKRPLVNYHKSVWGDYFLSYTPQLTEISSQEKLEHEELKEKVRQMLVETPDNSIQKLVLIDTIQRLGVGYHFENEIKISIQNIFDESDQSKNEDDFDDLYVVALRFRLVRQQRHYMSPDVFKKFTNNDGKFKETLTKDVLGLLSLYEAAHVRVHHEDILEEALTFTTTHLESMGPKLDNSLKAQVSEALIRPIHTNVPRVAARKYMPIYENIESHDDLLLKFAKLDFHILQKVHQRELSELTRWWNDLDPVNNFPYARDKLVECYYWAIGVYYEPQYRRARRTLTKLVAIITVTDDLYDAYATYDELVPFTDAVERCDIGAMDSISSYMRPLYQVFLDYFDEMEEESTINGKLDYVYCAKIETNRWTKSYLKEVEWLNGGKIPKCEEYKRNATLTIAIPMLVVTCLIVMEEFVAKETFQWILNDSLVLPASSLINRLKDDIIGHEHEQQREHGASFVECYMKEYGASKQDAYAEIWKEIANAWKDINTEYLRATQVPTIVLEPAVNLARLVEILQGDDFTNSKYNLKDVISMLFVDSVMNHDHNCVGV